MRWRCKRAELTVNSKPRHADLITFRYAAERYPREVLSQEALRMQRDNLKELAKLYEFFDAPSAPLDNIEPIHIRQYLDWRVQDAVKRFAGEGAGHKRQRGAGSRESGEGAVFAHLEFRTWARPDGKPNPCAGVRGFREVGRDTYVDDGTYQAVWAEADGPTRNAMELAYLTGQRPADVLELTIVCNEQGAALTALALRFRFENAREVAAKKARTQKRHELAAVIAALQFRDLRAKAGTDRRNWQAWRRPTTS
ncbi:hypothetical protein B0O95_103186 [Mycetohabitans endofungorum]|uniref:Uncharacterized protein n=2 Tax=Burkholderiaceae TaxID=119060 RepID=A0A2P5KCU5_9BURK|nr:hypothetical protein B0O95_103186 [Mycetohabitans endofungorum]